MLLYLMHLFLNLLEDLIELDANLKDTKFNICVFIYLFKSSETHTSATPLFLEKGAEVKMKLQDLKLLIKIH